MLTPKWKAIPFAVVNQVHCRLTPTQLFSNSKKSPASGKRIAHFMIAYL
ncbi:MAG: hypothetical protein LBK82_13475 [Planctomycetaceae bacterium]|nr:hypothetical protein [Planctomycetaceae bacterium]